MSIQAVLKVSDFPKGSIQEFGTWEGANYITILDGEQTRHLPTFINPVDDSTEVVIDFKPNSEWLMPWVKLHNIPFGLSE